jgi:hypothetical protein
MFGHYLMTNFPLSFKVLGGPFGSSQLVMAVSFARVYFHCHYLGDTVFGMLIGILVSQALTNIGIKGMMKTLFLTFFRKGGDSGIFEQEDM